MTDFKAIAMVHPSNTFPEDANGVSVPLALLPSNGEDVNVMNAFWEIIQKKPFADKCVRKDFVCFLSFCCLSWYYLVED